MIQRDQPITFSNSNHTLLSALVHFLTPILTNQQFSFFIWLSDLNMTSYLFSTLFFVLLVIAKQNTAKADEGRDVSGNSRLVGDASDEIVFDEEAVRNNARVGQGDSVSGNEMHLGSTSFNVYVNTFSTLNDASSWEGESTSVSGLEVSIGDVQGSDISIVDESKRNTANTNNGNETSTGISGSQVSIKELRSSNLNMSRTSEKNNVQGDAGTLVSGIQTNIGQAYFTDITSNDTSTRNTATASDNSTTVAGIQANTNAVQRQTTNLTLTAQDNTITGEGSEDKDSVAGVQINTRFVASSIFTTNSTSTDNVVEIENGTAVAGVQNNFNEVSKPFGQGSLEISLENVARDNKASTSETAVAGVQNNIFRLEDAMANLDSEAKYNTARSQNGTAVGGVQNNFNTVKDSTVNISNDAQFNYAYSGRVDGTAVAGAQTNMGQVINSDVTIYNKALYNYAKAKYGTAVGGAQVNLGSVSDGSNVAIRNNVANNRAYSENNAVVYSQTNIKPDNIEEGSTVSG
eukprot:TRINITY_DN1413_c0_g1_i1.p1 TRINITY_DN1413_c0_g1~~TRINITY_DN1413_c0_g1_i1.p1  ORF type:complete len:533 (-),score=68.63 TRINITY_DN1413_c0_g1_i1:849-2402(-)